MRSPLRASTHRQTRRPGPTLRRRAHAHSSIRRRRRRSMRSCAACARVSASSSTWSPIRVTWSGHTYSGARADGYHQRWWRWSTTAPRRGATSLTAARATLPSSMARPSSPCCVALAQSRPWDAALSSNAARASCTMSARGVAPARRRRASLWRTRHSIGRSAAIRACQHSVSHPKRTQSWPPQACAATQTTCGRPTRRGTCEWSR